MYYNVEFFFEKPYRLFESKEETEHTVTKEIFDLYLSGKYIKGDDGQPKRVEKIVVKTSQKSDAHIEELLEAVAGMNDLIISQQAEIELLKGEKQ